MEPYIKESANADTPRRPRRRPGENRAKLLDAAILEFGRSGFHGASTASIAQRADIPQPHVYVHFATKAELFLAALAGAYDAADQQQALTASETDVARAHQAEALMHLQAIAALGEPSLFPSLTELLPQRILSKGRPWHRSCLEYASERLLEQASASLLEQ